MSKVIQLPAQLTRFGSRVDGGAGLGFATRELLPEEYAELSKQLMKEGWLMFSENQFTDKDIPKGDAEVGVKTPSQRLRGVLYRYWQSVDKPQLDFEAFYRNEVEKIINHYKKKLNE